MKTLFTLLLIFTTALIARENPFEPTNAYEEEAARMVEINEVEEDYALEYQQEQQNQQYVNEMYEKMNNPDDMSDDGKTKKPKKQTITKDEIKKLIKDAQKQTVKETKKIVEKAVEKQPEIKEVVYVKPRLDVNYEKEILPFVKIEYDNDKIDIHSKYKVAKRLTLPGQKKIILDFNAKENFYTKREDLKSTSFLKIAVGNHQKENFFRVVIELAETPENYEVSYDNNMVSIVKLYEM